MNKYITLIVLLFPLCIFSQTKLDENVSITFPGKTKNIENVTKEAKLKAFYLNSKADSYIAMRVQALINNGLPQSTKELQKDYTLLAKDQLKHLALKGLFLKDSIPVKFKNYLAYKLILKGKDSEEENGESLILYLNGIAYNFIYSKVQSYDIVAKERFFNSIKITHSEKIIQIEEPYNYLKELSELLLCGLVLFFIRRYKKRRNNTNRVK